MSLFIHQDLAQKKWFELSLSEQLANVGSEFSRALNAKKNHKESRFEHAFARFFELLSLTLSDSRWTGPRKREIARLKEHIVGNLYSHPPNLRTLEPMEKYFYYFGVSRHTQAHHHTP